VIPASCRCPLESDPHSRFQVEVSWRLHEREESSIPWEHQGVHVQATFRQYHAWLTMPEGEPEGGTEEDAGSSPA